MITTSSFMFTIAAPFFETSVMQTEPNVHGLLAHSLRRLKAIGQVTTLWQPCGAAQSDLSSSVSEA
jgi:hypothetical protein